MACLRAALTIGSTMVASNTMIPITTSSSMRVNARGELRRNDDVICGSIHPVRAGGNKNKRVLATGLAGDVGIEEVAHGRLIRGASAHSQVWINAFSAGVKVVLAHGGETVGQELRKIELSRLGE